MNERRGGVRWRGCNSKGKITTHSAGGNGTNCAGGDGLKNLPSQERKVTKGKGNTGNLCSKATWVGSCPHKKRKNTKGAKLLWVRKKKGGRKQHSGGKTTVSNEKVKSGKGAIKCRGSSNGGGPMSCHKGPKTRQLGWGKKKGEGWKSPAYRNRPKMQGRYSPHARDPGNKRTSLRDGEGGGGKKLLWGGIEQTAPKEGIGKDREGASWGG